VVEDDEQHGTAAKEDGQSVEVIVGYHFGVGVGEDRGSDLGGGVHSKLL
jgi:hypothetical protein